MSDPIYDYFDTTFSRELLNLVKGKRLGSGSARRVYVYAPDPKLVIKFETGARSFQNAMEWETWRGWQEVPHVAKWLAPCKFISPCGLILLQERTEPMRKRELPEKIPTWATDTKIGNWGLLNGQPVMHDYGLKTEQLPNRLVKASWWGFEEGFDD
jgi:hypothetical protein